MTSKIEEMIEAYKPLVRLESTEEAIKQGFVPIGEPRLISTVTLEILSRVPTEDWERESFDDSRRTYPLLNDKRVVAYVESQETITKHPRWPNEHEVSGVQLYRR